MWLLRSASYAHRNRSMQIADGNNTVFYIKSIYLAHKRRQWERRKAESSIAFQHTPQRFAQPFRVSRIGVRICSRPAKKQCRSRSRKSSLPGAFLHEINSSRMRHVRSGSGPISARPSAVVALSEWAVLADPRTLGPDRGRARASHGDMLCEEPTRSADYSSPKKRRAPSWRGC
jgi:hypothetical protein